MAKLKEMYEKKNEEEIWDLNLEIQDLRTENS